MFLSVREVWALAWRCIVLKLMIMMRFSIGWSSWRRAIALDTALSLMVSDNWLILNVMQRLKFLLNSAESQPEIWKIFTEKKFPVEICLTSNVLCKSVPSYEDHHITRLLKAGNPVTICVSIETKTSWEQLRRRCRSKKVKIFYFFFYLLFIHSDRWLWRVQNEFNTRIRDMRCNLRSEGARSASNRSRRKSDELREWQWTCNG